MKTKMKEQAIELLWNSKNDWLKSARSEAWMRKHHPDVLAWIMEQYPLYDSMGQKMRAIVRGDYCRCQHCHEVMPFLIDRNHLYCSKKCGMDAKRPKLSAAWSYDRIDKAKQTCIERYGAAYPMQVKEISAKARASREGSYERAFAKAKATSMERYGTEWFCQSDAGREQARAKADAGHAKRLCRVAKEAGYNIGQHQSLAEAKQAYLTARGFDIDIDTASRVQVMSRNSLFPYDLLRAQIDGYHPPMEMLKKHFTNPYEFMTKIGIESVSSGQYEVIGFLKELGVEYNINNRRLIAPQELDVVIPTKQIAIEYNGVYWHDSFKQSSKDYHQKKTERCRDIGWQLIHIWEDEWLQKKDIVKSIIRAKLGLCHRIYARQTEARRIEAQEARAFLEANHLHGFRHAQCHYGLYHDGQLLMVCSFAKHASYEWELARMAPQLNHTVVGGLSKLLAFFRKEQSPRTMMTYADADISDARGYLACGFRLLGMTSPSYWYVHDSMKRYSRQQMQKSKLKTLLPADYDDALSEEAIILRSNQFFQIHNAGNLKLAIDFT